MKLTVGPSELCKDAEREPIAEKTGAIERVDNLVEVRSLGNVYQDALFRIGRLDGTVVGLEQKVCDDSRGDEDQYDDRFRQGGSSGSLRHGAKCFSCSSLLGPLYPRSA